MALVRSGYEDVSASREQICDVSSYESCLQNIAHIDSDSDDPEFS